MSWTTLVSVVREEYRVIPLNGALVVLYINGEVELCSQSTASMVPLALVGNAV